MLPIVHQSDPRWLPTFDIILEDANIHGTLEIVTSVLSITEVAFVAMERLNRTLDAREEARIVSLWTSPGITLVECRV